MRRSRRISYLTQSYETNSWSGAGGHGDEVDQIVELEITP